MEAMHSVMPEYPEHVAIANGLIYPLFFRPENQEDESAATG